MKVYYICECCDEVFDLVDSAKLKASGTKENLTGENSYGIIKQDLDNDNNYYVYSTCPGCREDIEGGSQSLFYREPLIN